ncbi:DUF1206 domain-containing protein [Sphingosinicella sp. CPCC 101087]|uniref:DUF1206 domain-containing protein n=1 Tax=Sphingosinicella sp. CPCC 101087 TaxID=2497754 RepID=UPI00101CEF81|nr:DUF1206 domain-containing protein [Sphingosinicella sp. CPCC 101087]
MFTVGRLEAMARLGFAARGLMYLLIGYLALRLGRTEDGAGALAILSSTGGRVVLAGMVVGFVGYGLWRLTDAAIDSEGHGDGLSGALVRAGGAMSGLIHLGLAWAAAKLALRDAGGGGGDGDRIEQGASTALDWPGGEIALLAGAAILLGVGAFQLVRAVKLSFLKHLDGRVAHRPWVAWLGRAGYAARGIVFLVMAWFLWRTFQSADAEEAGGMGQALEALPSDLQFLVAGGLALFGLFSLVEARHRRINDPHIVARLQRSWG